MALSGHASRSLSRQLLGAEPTLTAAPFRRATTFRNLVDGQNKGLVATKRTPSRVRTRGSSLLPHLGFWAGRQDVGGHWGAARLGLIPEQLILRLARLRFK
jgi:hypothetical protein